MSSNAGWQKRRSCSKPATSRSHELRAGSVTRPRQHFRSCSTGITAYRLADTEQLDDLTAEEGKGTLRKPKLPNDLGPDGRSWPGSDLPRCALLGSYWSMSGHHTAPKPANAVRDGRGVERMSAQFRNIGNISLSCPTRQVASSNVPRRHLCMGLFSIFWQRPLRHHFMLL